MVLATKVGRERSFVAGFFLTIVTFGIYAIYWNYKAHNELYRQFELEREGRDEGMVWYVLGLTLQPLLVAYMWIFASNVNYLRARIGLVRQMSPGKFVAVAGSGVGAIALAFILLAIPTFGLDESTPADEVQAAMEPYTMPALVSGVVGLFLLALAYRGLQRDINEVWVAYDARIAYLRQHPTEMRSPDMHALTAAADAAALVGPVAAEVDALRAVHPRLRALGELDSLVAAARAGDAIARERAEELLADVGGLLQERVALLSREEEPDAADRLEILDAALFDPGEGSREPGAGEGATGARGP